MTEPNSSLAPSGSWFAVWRWRRPWWAWCLCVVSLPAVYFFSAIPVVTLAVEVTNRTGLEQIYFAAHHVYRPVFWLAKHSEFAGPLLGLEQHVMLTLFGRTA